MGFDVVAIFAAGRAVEVVLAVGIELPDPLVVHIEPTEHGLARRRRARPHGGPPPDKKSSSWCSKSTSVASLPQAVH
jgi:hypothetical protein